MDYIRAEAQPADKFGHQPRVYALATKIGQGMDYDDDILFAAAWMHDIGVFLGHRPKDPMDLARWDHIPYTIERSTDLLLEWGFPAAKIGAVAEAIRSHQPDGDPVRIEAVLLRDADILEQIGAIGILRATVKVGRDTRYPSFASILPVLSAANNLLPGKLRLTPAMSLAVARVEMLRSFITAVESEAGAPGGVLSEGLL
jgi:uncharacterized protein